MEAFSTRHTDECRILNEKEVSGCGFLASVLGPKIKRALTTGVWHKAVVFHQFAWAAHFSGQKFPSLWRFFRASHQLCFIVFEKWCHPHLSLKNSVGKINKPTQRIKQENKNHPPKWMKKFTPITLLWSSSFHASWFRNYKRIFFSFVFFGGVGGCLLFLTLLASLPIVLT